MALPTASDNKWPKLFMEEVANDGSATTTPAADHRSLFVGEDGLLHLKDSSAVVTTPHAASGAVTSSLLTMATARLLGRTTASTGAIEEITVGTGLSLAAGSLTATGGGADPTYGAFTPTLTADGGNPNLGATGSATGRYTQHGKLVHAYGNIKFEGAGVSAGSGVYEIALPVTAHASSITGAMGTVVLYDDSAGLFNIAATYPLDTGEFRIAIGGTGLVASNATPWTWAANDQINFMIVYEAA